MITLSVFPYLLSYQQVSPVLIRLTLAGILIFWAIKGLHDPKQSNQMKLLDVMEGLLGLMLVLGLWTQIAALILVVGFLVCIVNQVRSKKFLTDGVNYMLILLILALSLLFTGPGIFALDYPL